MQYLLPTAPYSVGISEHWQRRLGLVLELPQDLHQPLRLSVSLPAVVGALQLVAKVHHLRCHVCDAVLQHLEFIECFLHTCSVCVQVEGGGNDSLLLGTISAEPTW